MKVFTLTRSASFAGILFILCLALPGMSQRILVQDIRQDSTLAGDLHNYTILFSLQNQISSTDFLLLVWPYALSGPTPSDYTGGLDSGIMEWGYYNTTTCSFVNQSTFALKQSSLSNNAYYVKLLDSANNQASLLKSRTYYLKFGAYPDASLSSGAYGPVQLHSISNDADENFVTYDSNPYAGMIQIDTVASTLSIGSNGISQSPGHTYNLEATITGTVAISGGFRLRITLDNSLSFYGACNSSSDSYVIESQTDTNSSSRYIYFKSDFVTSTTIALICPILNPVYAVASARINFMTLPYYAGNPIESGSITNINVNSFSADSADLSITTAFGINYTATHAANLPQSLIGFFKDCTDCSSVYNAITIYINMKENQLTPNGSFAVTITTAASINIIASTILHSFPNAPNSRVLCSVKETSNDITCVNVGALWLNTSHAISFMFNIPSSYSGTDLPSTFGQITISNSAGSQYYQGQPTIADLSIKTNLNISYYGVDTYGLDAYRSGQFVHGLVPGLGDPSSTTYGILYDPTFTNYSLIFEVSSRSSDIPSTPDVGFGTEFITSGSITIAEDSILTCTGTDTTVTFEETTSICSLKLFTQDYGNYTSLRFSPSAGWSSQYPSDAAKVRFTFQNISITSVSGAFLVQENNFFFYMRGTDSITAANADAINFGTTTSSQALINSFSVSNSATTTVFQSFGFGISFFWTGNVTSSFKPTHLTGSTFPAVLRIAGIPTTDEKANATRFRLFFVNLVPFYEQKDTSNKVYCNSTQTNYDQCYFNPGLNDTNAPVHLWNSIDVELNATDFEKSSSIQIVIPVQTAFNTTKLAFALAVGANYNGTVNTSTGGDYNTTYFVHTPVRDYAPINPNNFAGNDILDSKLMVSRAKGNQVGQQVTTYFVTKEISSADGVTNEANIVSAALMYCGTWYFNESSIFQIQSIPSYTYSSYEMCTTFGYVDSSSTKHICAYCPIGGDLYSQLPVTNFTFPYSTGLNMPNAYLVESLNDGLLYKYGPDGLKNQLTPAVITSSASVNVSSLPVSLIKGLENVQITITFTTSFTFPKDATISLYSSKLYFSFPSAGVFTCTVAGYSCSVTSASDLKADISLTTAPSKDFPPGTYSIVFNGIDISQGAGDQNYFGIQLYTSSGDLIAQSDQTFVFSATVPQSEQQLTIANATYLYNISGVRNVLMFQFSSTIGAFLSNTEILFSLGDLASQLTSSNFYCYATDASGAVLSTFKSCYYDAGTTNLTFILKDNLAMKDPMTIVVGNIISLGATTGLSAYIVRDSSVLYSNYDSAGTPAAEDLQTPGSLDTVTVQKNFNALGKKIDLVLSITTTNIEMSAKSAIIVTLPSTGYSPGLGSYEAFSCSIDGVAVACEFKTRFTLQIYSKITTITAGTQFVLTIFGIQQPLVISGSEQTISVLVIDNIFDTTAAEYKEVQDIAVGSYMNPLKYIKVSNFNVNSNYSGVSNTQYNFVIQYTESNIPSGGLLVFNFPSLYFYTISGLVSKNTTGGIREQGSTTWSEMTGGVYNGPQVIYPLPIALNSGTKYEIQISAPTTDAVQCSADKIPLLIASADKSTIYGEAVPSAMNGPYPAFNNDTSKSSFIWTSQINSTTSLSQPFVITTGIYSQEIYLVALNGQLMVNLELSLASGGDTNFKMMGTSSSASRGDLGIPIRIGCTNQIIAGTYSLTFSLNDTSGRYNHVPRLSVLVAGTPKNFSIPNFRVSPTAKTISYGLDFTYLGLVEALTLTFVPTNTNAIKVINKADDSASITFQPEDPTGTLEITALTDVTADSSVTDGSYFKETITVSITGTPQYGLSLITPTVSVVAFQDYTTGPNARPDVIRANGSYVDVGFRSNQLGTIYYALMRTNSRPITCQFIMNNASSYTPIDGDITELVMGVIEFTHENKLYGRRFTNLVGNKYYTISTCGENVGGIIGPLNQTTFLSSNTSGIIAVVNLTFSTPLGADAQSTLACFFSDYFLTRTANIITADGIQCKTSSRRVLQDSSTTSNSIIYYFYNDPQIGFSDNLHSRVKTALTSANDSNFQIAFKQKLSSVGANLVSYNYTTNASFTIPYLTGTLTVNYTNPDLTNGTLIINGLSIGGSKYGNLYLIMDDDANFSDSANKTQYPSTYQIQQGLNALGNKALFNMTVPYNSSSTISLTFTGLQDLKYVMFAFADNDQPQPLYKDYSDIVRLIIDVSPLVSTSAAVLKTAFGLVISLIVLFSLMLN